MAFLLLLQLCRYQKLGHCDACFPCNVCYHITELQAIQLACKPEMPSDIFSASQKRRPNQWHSIRLLNLLNVARSSDYKGALLPQLVSGLKSLR